MTDLQSRHSASSPSNQEVGRQLDRVKNLALAWGSIGFAYVVFFFAASPPRQAQIMSEIASFALALSNFDKLKFSMLPIAVGLAVSTMIASICEISTRGRKTSGLWKDAVKMAAGYTYTLVMTGGASFGVASVILPDAKMQDAVVAFGMLVLAICLACVVGKTLSQDRLFSDESLNPLAP